MKDISNQEYNDILTQLQDFHTIFYQSWKMSKPTFSDKIDTACVQFNTEGNYVNFIFNPTFWDTCSNYEKIFVICHETLHVILNHGQRFKTVEDQKLANIAMDLAINHSLVNRFGFDRNNMNISKELCWVDKFFPENVADDENAETYYVMLIESDNKSLQEQKTLDDHSFLNGAESTDFSEIIKKINDATPKEDKANLDNFLKIHDGGKKSYGAGSLFDISNNIVQKKKKWESVIKKWTLKTFKNTDLETLIWFKKSRRYNSINHDIKLPSDEFTNDFNSTKSKTTLLFFLDTSGSCIELKDRFFNAAKSLNKNKFDINLFCFDTKVYETSLDTKQIYGGGGTSFTILEKYIQQNFESYPKAIFVLTDGLGDVIEPKIPKNWHWFIYNKGNFKFMKNYINAFIPKDSNIYDLSNFE